MTRDDYGMRNSVNSDFERVLGKHVEKSCAFFERCAKSDCHKIGDAPWNGHTICENMKVKVWPFDRVTDVFFGHFEESDVFQWKNWRSSVGWNARRRTHRYNFAREIHVRLGRRISEFDAESLHATSLSLVVFFIHPISGVLGVSGQVGSPMTPDIRWSTSKTWNDALRSWRPLVPACEDISGQNSRERREKTHVSMVKYDVNPNTWVWYGFGSFLRFHVSFSQNCVSSVTWEKRRHVPWDP